MVADTRDMLKLPKRSHPLVRAIAAQWRTLTSPARSRARGPGEPIVIACSAGADSSALCIALAAAHARFVIAHVVHDLRPASDAERDCDAAAALAKAIGAPFVTCRVGVRAIPGNSEANARRLRYDALTAIARERGLRFIATAHHAQDNLESLLMTIARGGSLRALGGIRPRLRWPGSDITVIRPMLTLSPAQTRGLCSEAGWTWAHDATNDDRSGDRVRSALRHRVVPELLGILPDALNGARRTSRLASGAAAVVEHAARSAMTGSAEATEPGDLLRMPRVRLAALPPVVIGEVLRNAIRSAGVPGSARSLSQKTLEAIGTLICSDATDPRVFHLRAMDVLVDAHQVRVRMRDGVARAADSG